MGQLLMMPVRKSDGDQTNATRNAIGQTTMMSGGGEKHSLDLSVWKTAPP